MKHPDLYEELSQAVQRAGTLTVLHTNAVAHRVGISATEFEAMDIISRNQPITAGQLAEECGLTTGAVTGILDRLERGKFVCRRRDPEDRRRVFIVPIENKARNQKVRELYKPMSECFQLFVNRYSPDQIRFLIDMQNLANDMTEKAIKDLRNR
jgi:DNA-binding MarR family transcriptional regulator